jgi:GDP/UDP-N,N'-diacetylbacillosamine 2-epimerase (hydrolysing)
MKLKVCFFTGSRADYGLLFPLIRKMTDDNFFDVSVIASGMHLSPEFGYTVKDIEKDGVEVTEKVEVLISGDSPVSTAKAVGLGLISYSESLARIKPDWLVILGDRFEAFAVAAAAHLLTIPIIHISGGEVTEGATDDALRHAITKMAYLHFTSTEEYKTRVIQLGESPNRVFNVGALGLDNIRQLPLLSKRELEQELDFSLTEKTILITFHPVTMEKNSAAAQMKDLLAAIDYFPNLRVVFTFPNADTNGRVIIDIINKYVQANSGRAKAFISLGQLKYLSLLQYVSAAVGNSSSGIVEVPQFKIPTVNIGDRQSGRLKATSVIDAATDIKSIVQALKKAFSPAFAAVCKKTVNPYGKGNTAGQIVKAVRKTGRIGSTQKPFYDLPRL